MSRIMHHVLRIKALGFIFYYFFFIGHQALAQGTPKVAPGRYGYKDPLGGVDIPRLIGGVIRFSMGIVGALFLLMFVYGGFLWMTAGGEGKRVEKAKETIKNAIFGMMIIMLSYTLVSFILEIAKRLQT